jgi:uncharacterized membrane protein
VNFSHECSALLDKSVKEICLEWATARTLPSLLSHIRAAELRDHEPDIARIIVSIEHVLFEIPIQRTMCEAGMVCWQSLDPKHPYVLNVVVSTVEAGKSLLHVTVAYDPPGVIPDIVETLGGGAAFTHTLDTDLHAYRATYKNEII